MKAKYILLAVLLATLLVTPAFGFWHPPIEIPCPVFGVMINGKWAYEEKLRYNFTEPFDNFCDDVKVEIYVLNVTDLYGYEFELWWDSTYFSLKSWKVEHIHAADIVVLPVPEAGGPWTKPQPYKQVVSAVAPATGVSGNFLVATLTFHIVNDVCWCQDDPTGRFWIKPGTQKMSDSCGQSLEPCEPLQGLWRFKAVQPKVYLVPKEEINWVVGDKFKVEVWVENITKMKSINLSITWDWRYHSRCIKANSTHGAYWDNVWLQLLNVSMSGITINPDVFPSTGIEYCTIKITKGSPASPEDRITVEIKMKSTYPLINGTFKVMDIVFKKLDPWHCGRQPMYEFEEPHAWIPENASTPIRIYYGWLDVYCPTLCYIEFGDYFGPPPGPVGERCRAMHGNSNYIFMPVPGDLDGSGHVDVVDLAIIAGNYGNTMQPANTYYDLNRDCTIDIFDIVIVAKNFCRTSPL